MAQPAQLDSLGRGDCAVQQKEHAMYPSHRHILVSNCLPIVVTQQADTWQVAPAVGGLVTALAPILRDHGGLWIGWTGLVDGEGAAVLPLLAAESQSLGYTLQLRGIGFTPIQ